MKTLIAMASVVCLTSVVAAQGPAKLLNSKRMAPKSSLAVTVAGLNCTASGGAGSFEARAWSWGASNPLTVGTGGGAGSGKVSVSDLSLTRAADACSPALLGAVATGKHFASLTLIQQDADGVATATVTLTDVLITSWQIGGDAGSADATESVSVGFRKFCFADAATGNSFCYDLATGKVV